MSVLHQQSGGTGTYEDPITAAIPGHHGFGIWTKGAKLYIPKIQRYVMVENSGASPAPDGMDGHLDVWIGGEGYDAQDTYRCAEHITGNDVPAIYDPPPNQPVIEGPLFDNGKCNTAFLNHSNSDHQNLPHRGSAQPNPGTLPRNVTGLYPWVIQLAYSETANGTLILSVFNADSETGMIYRSTDQGKTFTEVGNIHDPAAVHGICCSTLFEPKQVGALASLDAFDAQSQGNTPEEIRTEHQAAIPIGRYGDPQEFGDVVVFFCSERASYISGCTVLVDGGKLWGVQS